MKNTLQKISLGSWITLSNPAIAEILAKAGFEWLVVDLEHSMISFNEAAELIRVIDLCGAKPYVRITSNDANQIKRVMDAGAQGIIVPMVNSLQDVEKAAAAMFYPPKGTRGVGLARAQGYGAGFNDYLVEHKNFDLIVQIEHIDAITALDDILSHPDLRGFIVGPYDLSASMKIPGQFDDARFQEALDKIQMISAKYPHVKRGFHLVEPSTSALENLVRENYNFIAYSVDIRMLDVSARTALSKFQEIARECTAL